ncbi:hypothetical protein Fmac_011902 [Flemingia macrophylla]|uniref:Uncharacterized protein n=1 Tax=Flemingia macrophylla TaxID=520843 RepID=A0ABD1MP62_9FABA
MALYIFHPIAGSIPIQLANLTQLTRLYLHDNLLTGSIPSTLGHLKKLFDLDLHSNQITGFIPRGLGNSSLKFLYLSHNSLFGSIPSKIANSMKLIEVDLSHNNLTGSIPPLIFQCPSIRNVDLSCNLLNGSITSQINCVYNLNLSHNFLEEKCDVYSFGVVTLETLTGRDPRELISFLSNSTTQNMLLKDLLDPRLALSICQKDTQDIMIVVSIALACLCSKPKFRPSMQDVSCELSNFKMTLLSSFHEISIHQLMTREICHPSCKSQD